MARPRRRNPWTSTGEVLLWVLFAALLFPAGFAGWAVGHYTSLGKSAATVVHTVTLGSTPATTTSATTTSAATTAASPGGGNPAAGKPVFAANGCATCHTFTQANATGTIGPNLNTQPSVGAKATNLSIAAFVKRCITNPSAYIPTGYHAGLMPTTFAKSLSSTQLNNLVAFIVLGAKS